MKTFPDRFSGQNIIVTGGASGIGRAVAVRLAREGAGVTLFDVNEQTLAEVARLFASEGLNCRIVRVDVSDENSVIAGVNKVIQAAGSLQVLVHSAGITGPTGKKITEISVEDYDRVYRVNQRGAFLLARHTLPFMIEQGYGRILMFASIAGKDGNPGMSPYNSTKAAVIGLVKGLGKEFAESGVTINAVAPAVIRTPMNENTSREQLRYMIEKIPMKRLGTVDEAAALAAWVCSREASFTTGFVFDLSGGRAVY